MTKSAQADLLVDEIRAIAAGKTYFMPAPISHFLATESTPSGMVMVDQQGQIILVNSQAEKLFGYPRKELIGQNVEILVPERLRGRHSAYRGGFFPA